MAQLARGEVGLIITGFAYVMPNGQSLPRQLGIHNNAMIPDLKKLTSRVHGAGAKIAMQIVHAGVQTVITEREEDPVWGPSAVPDKLYGWTPKAMTQGDIKETVQAFARAARRVKKAGFDAVQLHSAHGFLISQFLSPFRNKRTDKYGGPIENRARFLFETYRAVRKTVGKGFPVLVKLNTKDFVRGGFQEKDALFVAKSLDKMGIDAIEMSGGIPASGDLGPAREKIRKTSDEAYFLPFAKRIKKQVAVPLILVGGVRSLKAVNHILDTGSADLVSMARPLVREPDLVKRWKAGNHKKAKCVSCNQCFGAANSSEGIYCVLERRVKEKRKKKK
jgi:2,4-dienoyl-CoA reductase-like NADH-dependent reductase (Old Yellow Enzyme family)